MAQATTATEFNTIADLLEALGDVPPGRVRLHPTPGTATEQDVINVRNSKERRLCELVDGTLVEKAMGYRESLWAMVLGWYIGDFLRQHDLGVVSGPDGTMRLMPGLVRIPDIAFTSWDRFPGGEIPKDPIPDLAPDLAVEVLSASNTKREMERKLREYFEAGVRLVWYADPAALVVDVHTPDGRSVRLGEDGTLDGGDVLPGFVLPLREWFDEADRRGPRGA
jgi:Uma2 family endonuclease